MYNMKCCLFNKQAVRASFLQNRVRTMIESPRPARSRKIRKISIVDQVYEDIRQRIAEGEWQPGDKLPSEQDLADSYGVNRLSVRMAMQRFSALGITETIGNGSYVKAFSMQAFFKEIAVFYSAKEEFQDVKELRQLLESECIRLAAVRASEDEIQTLKKALEEYNRLGLEYEADVEDEGRLDRAVDADLAFHMQVVAMSHNRLYAEIYTLIKTLIRNNIRKLLRRRVRARKEKGLPPYSGSDTHNKIYQAIADDDPAKAYELSAEMVGLTQVEGLDIFS